MSRNNGTVSAGTVSALSGLLAASSDSRLALRVAVTAILASFTLSLGGCGKSPAPVESVEDDAGDEYYDDYYDVEMSEAAGVSGPKFRSVKSSNSDFTQPVDNFVFQDEAGQDVTLGDLAAGQPVLLVVTRGATEPLCPACNAQVARLYSVYDQFQALGAEIVVVFPRPAIVDDVSQSSEEMRFGKFLSNVTASARKSDPPPFPIVFDNGAMTVKALGIDDNLAKPSSFLFDADHKLLFAYVGASMLDRPDIDSLIDIVSENVVSENVGAVGDDTATSASEPESTSARDSSAEAVATDSVAQDNNA